MSSLPGWKELLPPLAAQHMLPTTLSSSRIPTLLATLLTLAADPAHFLHLLLINSQLSSCRLGDAAYHELTRATTACAQYGRAAGQH